MPVAAFRPATRWTVRVSKQALVRHLRVAYSVPTAHVGQSVTLYAYWDHVEIWDATRMLATYRLSRVGQPPQLQLDHYLDVLRQKPGAVRNARVVRDLGPCLHDYQAAFFHGHPEAYAAFVAILFLFRRFPAAQVLAALPAAQEARCFDPEGLQARLMAAGAAAILQPDPAVYGQLLEGGTPS